MRNKKKLRLEEVKTFQLLHLLQSTGSVRIWDTLNSFIYESTDDVELKVQSM